MAVQSCLVHSQKRRGQFHHLVNVLQNTGLVPKKYVSQVQKVICTCRPNTCHDDIDDILPHLDDQPTMRSSLFNQMDPAVWDQLTAGLHQLVDCKPSPDMDHAQLDLGCRRLVYVLNRCEHEEFQLLQCPSQPVSDGGFSAYQTTFKVACPRHYMGVVFGANGSHIKPFLKEHNCAITMMTRLPRQADGTLLFRLRAKSAIEGKTIETLFRQMVDRAIENRETHEGHLSRYLAKRMVIMQEKAKRYEARRLRDLANPGRVSPYVAAMSLKENAQIQYETKYQHIVKKRNQRGVDAIEPSRRELASCDTVCALCLQTYTECVAQGDESAVKTCTHHPGYLKETPVNKDGAGGKKMYQWTCCKEEIDDKSWQARKESHRTTGCPRAARSQHRWKSHKSVNMMKKYKSALDKQERDSKGKYENS